MQLRQEISRSDWATSVLQIDSPVFLGIKRIFSKPVWPRTNFIQQQKYFNPRPQYFFLGNGSIRYIIISKQMGNFFLTQNSSKNISLDVTPSSIFK